MTTRGQIYRGTLYTRNSLPSYPSLQREWKAANKGIPQKMDQKQCLHYRSSHPKIQKEAVPYRLLIRVRRICSKDTDFKEEATTIITSLL